MAAATNMTLLTSTLHDPKGALYDALDAASQLVPSMYEGWVINVTPATDEGVQKMLKTREGIYLTKTEPAMHPGTTDAIEMDHLSALSHAHKLAKEQNFATIQYTDGDRIAMAARHFPRDLENMARRSSQTRRGMLHFPRDEEAFTSHHPALMFTEEAIIHEYSRAFGMPIDPGSTAHTMTQEVVEEILNQSPQMEPVSFPHPKWLIIARQNEQPIETAESGRVLMYETPEQQRAKIEGLAGRPVGDYRELVSLAHSIYKIEETASPTELSLRLRTQQQYLKLLDTHLGEIVLDPELREAQHKDLERTVHALDRDQEMVGGAWFGSARKK